MAQMKERIEGKDNTAEKLEILFEYLSEYLGDLSPHFEETFSTIKNNIQKEREKEKKKSEEVNTLTPEVIEALENLCRSKGRKEYHQEMVKHGRIEDVDKKNKCKLECTMKEFPFIA